MELNPTTLLSLDRLDPKDQIIDDNLICQICFNIVQYPVECTICQSLICSYCAYSWFQKKLTCPNNCDRFQLVKPHKSYIQQLSKINFSCLKKEDGCNILITFNNLEIHNKECQFLQQAQQNNMLEYLKKLQQQLLQQDFEALSLKNPAKQQIVQQPEVQQIQQQAVPQLMNQGQEYYWFWFEKDQKFTRYPLNLENFFTKSDSQNLKIFNFQLENRQYSITKKNDVYLQKNVVTGQLRNVQKIQDSDLYKKVIWVCNSRINEFKKYDEVNNQKIEDAYQQFTQGKDCNIVIKVRNLQYTLNFLKMVQINKVTQYNRRVYRLTVD